LLFYDTLSTAEMNTALKNGMMVMNDKSESMQFFKTKVLIPVTHQYVKSYALQWPYVGHHLYSDQAHHSVRMNQHFFAQVFTIRNKNSHVESAISS
jgi:hypothetical protein